jgi:hypothetical protein
MARSCGLVHLYQISHRHISEDPNLHLLFIFITVLYFWIISKYCYEKCLPNNLHYWIFAVLRFHVTQSSSHLPTFRINLSVPSLRFKQFNTWTAGSLEMGPIGCPETLVINYHYSHYNPDKWRSHSHSSRIRNAAVYYFVSSIVFSLISRVFYYVINLFIFSGSAAQRGLWPPRSRGFLITHNNAPQSVGLLWTSDQLVAETSTWQHTTHTTDKHPCPRWDSKPRSQQASGSRPTP